MPVTLDMADDLAPASTIQKRNLLLAPPSIAAHEEKLRAIFTTYDRSVTDLQMLDRLSAGYVTLPSSTYDLVLVLSDPDGARRAEALQLLNRDVYNTLVPSMKPGGKFQLEDGGKLDATEASEAILAGLIEKDGGFEKMVFEEASVPLRLGGRKKKAGLQNGLSKKLNGTSEKNDDSELIDEDTLLSGEDLKRPLHQRQFIYPSFFSLSPVTNSIYS